MPKEARVIPRVVVIIDSGVVSDVIGEIPLDVEVIDLDTDGTDLTDDLIETEAGQAVVYSNDSYSIDPKALDKIWDTIQRMRKSR